jgi:hypothetical protein
LQLLPQPPQFDESVEAFVSQPLSDDGAVGWLQFANPSRQVDEQTPPEQASDRTLLAAHGRSHAPQC